MSNNNEIVPSMTAAQNHFKAAEFAIRALDNPDPLVILGIVLAIIIVIFIIYIYFFKQHMNGIWVEQHTGEIHTIKHNIFTDNILIDNTIPAELDGLVVHTALNMGLISANRLAWFNSKQLGSTCGVFEGEIWLRIKRE